MDYLLGNSNGNDDNDINYCLEISILFIVLFIYILCIYFLSVLLVSGSGNSQGWTSPRMVKPHLEGFDQLWGIVQPSPV